MRADYHVHTAFSDDSDYPMEQVVRDILGLYQSLGGHILTIGSDSHKPAHLGAYIEETKQELRALGFKEFCTFEKMVPKYHPL